MTFVPAGGDDYEQVQALMVPALAGLASQLK